MGALCRIVLILMMAFASCHAAWCRSDADSVQQRDSLDSSTKAALASRMAEYLDALKHEDIEIQKQECDFMIEAASDSLVRQYVALSIYDHYMDSKVMGAEAVAIHIIDKWFLSGRIGMRDDMELFAAKVFAEFNRQSQIGNKAPELLMQTLDGQYVTVFGNTPSDRFRVLYFYDTDCAKCRLHTMQLKAMIEDSDYPIDVYAVYASDNRDAWQEYISANFPASSGSTVLHHLWDPELDSDFQRKYGVIQTPRMFLIAPDGTILGRSLDVSALKQMLSRIFGDVELEYGSKESSELFDRLFMDDSGSSDILSYDDIVSVSDHMVQSALKKGDSVMCRQLTGDMLYYLASKKGEGAKEGLRYVIKNHILGRDDIWKSKDDSLKIIGFAQVMDDLLAKSAPGTGIADIRLPGTLYRKNSVKEGTFRLPKLGGERNIIIFYTGGCGVCAAEKEAASVLLETDRNLKVLMVNVDEIISSYPALAGRIFDQFDLSSLPYIIETDSKGNILHRYVSLIAH